MAPTRCGTALSPDSEAQGASHPSVWSRKGPFCCCVPGRVAGYSHTIYLNSDPSGMRDMGGLLSPVSPTPTGHKERRGLCFLPLQPRLCGTWSSAKQGAAFTKFSLSWVQAVEPLSTGCAHFSVLFHIPQSDVQVPCGLARRGRTQALLTHPRSQHPEGYMHPLDNRVTHIQSDYWSSLREAFPHAVGGPPLPAARTLLQGS